MDRGIEIRRDMIPGRGRFYSKFPKPKRKLSPEEERRERRIVIYVWSGIIGLAAFGAWMIFR